MSDQLWSFRGGTVVDALGVRQADVTVQGDTIVAVGEGAGSGRSIDVSGCYIMPGVVDIQVHFRTPGGEVSETMETGAASAALGGVTACVMMPNTTPTIDSVELVRDVRQRAVGLPCDVLTSAAITVDRVGERLTDFEALYNEGVRIFTDDGTAVANAALMREALAATVKLPGAVVAQHAEDPDLVGDGSLNESTVAKKLGVVGRPREAEEVIVARDLILARHTGGRYHVLHMSTAEALDLVRAARAAGVRATAEVTPQHLLLTENDVEPLGTSGKMNPPLRESSDTAALREGLRDGTIDAIATDHAPHSPESKCQPLADAPPGMLGVETSAAVVFSELVANGDLDLQQAVRILSTNPAAIAGIGGPRGHGGPITAGTAANLAVIDPQTSWVVTGTDLASRSDNTPWQDREFSARVRHTVLRGRFTVQDSRLVG
ncbi:MAG: dihydroorotase [Actinomycetota bacterium]